MRIKYYNSQNGDINKINFNIPEVKDRPLKVVFVAFDPRGEDKVSFSVGVNYLESALKQQFEEKVDILMLDDQLQSVDDIKKQLEIYQPDFIGVASKIHTYHKSSPFLDYCKKEFPNALTAIGGTTATYAFKEILKEHPDVVAIAGNGEKSVWRTDPSRNSGGQGTLHGGGCGAFLSHRHRKKRYFLHQRAERVFRRAVSGYGSEHPP